jgi:8-hydroxy-5-deazaflavin:NADPH oxidoreductase
VLLTEQFAAHQSLIEKLMKIAIVGTGNVGSVLGRRLAEAAHEVAFVSRTPEGERAHSLKALPGVVDVVGNLQSLIGDFPVILYAGPYDNAQAILESTGDFNGTILVDCTNPLNKTFDGLQLGHSESAGEMMSRWAIGARVVKSFNTTSVATMKDPVYSGVPATQFYCGDDPQAKQIVSGLIRDLKMEPVDAGPLKNARYLEATAMLYIHLAVREGWGGNCALKMMRR